MNSRKGQKSCFVMIEKEEAVILKYLGKQTLVKISII